MSVKLTELREPRLEAREPRLLPEETVRVLADRLKREEQPGARGWSLLVPTASRASGLLHEEQNSASGPFTRRFFNTSERFKTPLHPRPFVSISFVSLIVSREQ